MGVRPLEGDANSSSLHDLAIGPQVGEGGRPSEAAKSRDVPGCYFPLTLNTQLCCVGSPSHLLLLPPLGPTAWALPSLNSLEDGAA